MVKKITRFEDMDVWQHSQELAVSVYKLTSAFPDEEKFSMTNQLRRAVSSVSANIAEGFGRDSNKDKAHFYHIARGSLLETKNFIYLASRLGYITQDNTDDIIKATENINSQITAILAYFNNRE